MKILFLDMDGIVNKGRDNASPDRYHYNDKWSNPSDRFDLYYVDPELAARVSALVADFDLRIVSTSTWRCGKTVDEFIIKILVGHMLMSYIYLTILLIFDKFLICSCLNIIFDASFRKKQPATGVYGMRFGRL